MFYYYILLSILSFNQISLHLKGHGIMWRYSRKGSRRNQQSQANVMMPLNFYGPKSGCSLFSPSFPSILFSLFCLWASMRLELPKTICQAVSKSLFMKGLKYKHQGRIREGPNSPVYFNRLMNDWWVKNFLNL